MVLFVGALAQSAVGLGFGLVSIPFLVALLGPHEAIRTVVLLALPLAASILIRDRRGLQARSAGMLFIPAAIAIFALAPLVRQASTSSLAITAGVLTLVAVGLLASGLRAEGLGGRRGAIIAGLISGGMNVVSGIGGPPVALYAVNAGWPPASIRPTLNLYFIMIGSITLLALGLPVLRPELLIGVAVGWLTGGWLMRRAPENILRNAVLAVAAAGGLLAIVQALP